MALLPCTRYSAGTQSLAFFPINKRVIRNCPVMPLKDRQRLGRALSWNHCSRSTQNFRAYFWFLFCWEHVWQSVMAYWRLQYQVDTIIWKFFSTLGFRSTGVWFWILLMLFNFQFFQLFQASEWKSHDFMRVSLLNPSGDLSVRI